MQCAAGWAVCAVLPLGGQVPQAAQAAAAPATAASAMPAKEPPIVVSARHQAQAERHYLRGAKELEDHAYADAETSFAKAVAANPLRQEYLQALAVAQEHRITSLLQTAAQVRDRNPAEADRLLAQARGVDPDNPRVQQHDGDTARVARSGPTDPLLLPAVRQQGVFTAPIAVEPTVGRHDFHMRGDTRTVAEAVASAYGVHAVFDADLQPKPNLRMDADGLTFAEAMQTFSMLSGTFSTPVDPHRVLVAADTTQNRLRLERLVEEVLPLPGYTAEQITDAANMLRSVFVEQAKVGFEPQQGLLAVRAPAVLMEPINSLLQDLLDTGSEVMVDVKVYTVNSEKVRNVGVTLPSSIGAFNVLSEATNIVSTNQTLVNQLIANGVIPAGTSTTNIAAYLVFIAGISSSSNLKNTFAVFGGSGTIAQTGLTAGSFPVLNLALQQTDARELDDVQLRVADRTSGTVKSGTRYPIQTSLFSDIATSSTSSLAGVSVNGVSLSSLLSQYLGTSSLGSSAVVPQIQYEDLGLVLKAEPHVQRGGSVGLHLEIKITALQGASLNGIPVLASRQFTSDMTVADGQTILMASNVTESELKAATGIPGLNEIPGFQGGTNRLSDVAKGNLVVLITPHIVREAHRAAKGPYLPLPFRPEVE